jgi:hypothetical protein
MGLYIWETASHIAHLSHTLAFENSNELNDQMKRTKAQCVPLKLTVMVMAMTHA